jgi:type II secretory pathway component PulJ
VKFNIVSFNTKSFQKNNSFKNNPGVLLIETMLYIVLSTITITLLFQLALQIYTQSKLIIAQQIGRNNLWVATDLLQRDLQKLANITKKEKPIKPINKNKLNNLKQVTEQETNQLDSPKTPIDFADLVHWSLRNHKLYRQIAARPVCMLEQVQEFKIVAQGSNIAQILVTATCGAKQEQVTRLVFLRNF